MITPPYGEVILKTGTRIFDSAALIRRALKVASGFQQMGLTVNDSVAGLLRNDVAFFDLLEGTALAGVRYTPINWHLTSSEIAYILNDSDAKVLVAHEDLLNNIDSSINSDIQVLVVKTPLEIKAAYNIDSQPAKAHYECWESWLAKQADNPKNVSCPGSLMLYTSGSTGKPKGVKRISQPLGAQKIYLEGIGKAFGLRKHAKVVITGPLYHAAPLGYARFATQLGCDMWLMPRFDAEGLLSLIQEQRLSHMHMVPVMFYRLLQLPRPTRDKYDLSSLRSVCHGAAPCPADIKRSMIEWWGPIISEYYGSTEASLSCAASSEEWLERPGTVGKPLPGVTLKIYGEQGEELPSGMRGEIFVRQISAPDFDYHKRPQARHDIEHNGLVTNGDIGYQDTDGYVYLAGRKKDMIISGGVNIYPAEIEAELLTHPNVDDCAVFGIPDSEFGESVIAAIQPSIEQETTAWHIRTFLTNKLARFKIPREFLFLEQLPRFDNGKIYKERLRDDYMSSITTTTVTTNSI